MRTGVLVVMAALWSLGPVHGAPVHGAPAGAPRAGTVGHVPAGRGEPRRIDATPVRDAPPVLDGRLDDAVWAAAAVATDFVQLGPAPGEAATRATEARVVYDDQAIYVGIRLYDDPDSIAVQLARRDATDVYSDWAHVVIDSYNDRRTAFRFSVTPRGTKKDVLHYDDTAEDLNWDAVWDAAAAIDSLGWTAEFRIPLSQLRYSANGGGSMVWGINFGREIARRDERSWWAPILPSSAGFVSESGELHGLEGLGSPGPTARSARSRSSR